MNVATDTDWKKAYWDLIYNRSYAPAEIYPLLREIDQLRELIHKQAGMIMELEFMLSCIHRTGDTLYVDYQKMQSKLGFIAPPGLAASKYLRYPYE